MPKKGYSPEQIINKLREAEVMVSQGNAIATVTKKIGVTLANLLPLAQRVRWDEGGAGQASQGAGEREHPA